MARRVVIRSAAKADILERFVYLVDQDALTAADRFLIAVSTAVERISEMPGIGTLLPLDNQRLGGLRSWPLPGFEAIRLYYLTTDEAVRIVRVLHGSMDLPRILDDEPDY